MLTTESRPGVIDNPDVRRGLNKKTVSKSSRSNLEKITVAVAAAVAVASLTYGGICLYENTKEVYNNEILASDFGYPQPLPRPAPSDPRRSTEVPEISVPIVVDKIPQATPCPAPSAPAKLG